MKTSIINDLRNSLTMKMYYTLALLLYVMINPLTAQGPNTITGTSFDTNGNPLIHAYVQILDAKTDTFITGTQTNEEGEFEIDLYNSNDYILVVSYVGMNDYKSEVRSLSANMVPSLEIIELTDRAYPYPNMETEKTTTVASIERIESDLVSQHKK